MVEDSCVFCRIIGGMETVSIVYEDDRVVAFMDIQPVTPGHTLIVSRDHYRRYSTCPGTSPPIAWTSPGDSDPESRRRPASMRSTSSAPTAAPADRTWSISIST